MVIPCLNEERNLERLVAGLIAPRAGYTTQIIIVDGGSTDGTVQAGRDLAARFPNVMFLDNPKRIQSAAINLAVATFGRGAEFLVRIDAHADYPSNYCEVLVEEAQRTDASAVVVAMMTVGTEWFQRAVARAQNSMLGNGGAAHRAIPKRGMWTEHGHHALMRIDAFSRVGGYDESFSHNEDAELDIRLRDSGFKIWLTGRTSVNYYPRASPASLFRQYVNFGAGRAKTMIKHRTAPKLRQLAPAAVLPAVVLAFGAPIVRAAAIPLATWVLLCLVYGMCLGLKERSTSAAASGRPP